MYNNNYSNAGYSNTYDQYSAEYGNNYGYQDYNNYPNQIVQPSAPDLSQPPPVISSQVSSQGNFTLSNWSSVDYHDSKTDAAALENQHPNAQIIKQREDYVKKASVLKNDLEQLQKQQQEMYEKRETGPEFDQILVQNNKLQDQIQGKIKAVQNVVNILSDIIKDGKSLSTLESEICNNHHPVTKSRSSNIYSDSSSSTAQISELPVLEKYSEENVCYMHYDTGLHWCRTCDEFPQTAKDFLLHLQDKKHQQLKKNDKVDSTPWHKLPPEPLLPSNENAPKKRIPIKGLQFFISAPAWYCRLCDVWIGDLHCASHHLKSKVHHQNFEIFVEQNPHWEVEWLKDRERSMTRKREQDSSDSDDDSDRKYRKKSPKVSSKDKKKKKKSKKKKKQSSDSSSSSSSSDSSDNDRSKSIRVAMRNMNKVSDLSEKLENVLERIVEEQQKKDLTGKNEKDRIVDSSDDRLINQWMAVSEPPPKEKLLLMSLKDRMREKKEQELLRITEREKLRREKEQEDLDRLEQKRRDDRRAAEEADRLKKQKELAEIQKMKEIQLRFKGNNYRKRKSGSPYEEDDALDSYEKKEKSSRSSRSRSRSTNREIEESDKRKPPGPPSYKKLPFIGRMPLFKNKSKQIHEEKEEPKEIQKHSYEPPRKTRFEPGNLPRAYIPKPDVVCFPKLSSIPPLTLPPPPPTVEEPIVFSKAPKRAKVSKKQPAAPVVPSPPATASGNISDDDGLYTTNVPNSNTMNDYYADYGNNQYEHDIYSYQEEQVPHSHSMPLQPPPLPPDDDLALLGICADDMAAQSF